MRSHERHIVTWMGHYVHASMERFSCFNCMDRWVLYHLQEIDDKRVMISNIVYFHFMKIKFGPFFKFLYVFSLEMFCKRNINITNQLLVNLFISWTHYRIAYNLLISGNSNKKLRSILHGKLWLFILFDDSFTKNNCIQIKKRLIKFM